jgi:hypothetical protein
MLKTIGFFQDWIRDIPVGISGLVWVFGHLTHRMVEASCVQSGLAALWLVVVWAFLRKNPDDKLFGAFVIVVPVGLLLFGGLGAFMGVVAGRFSLVFVVLSAVSLVLGACVGKVLKLKLESFLSREAC